MMDSNSEKISKKTIINYNVKSQQVAERVRQFKLPCQFPSTITEFQNPSSKKTYLPMDKREIYNSVATLPLERKIKIVPNIEEFSNGNFKNVKLKLPNGTNLGEIKVIQPVEELKQFKKFRIIKSNSVVMPTNSDVKSKSKPRVKNITTVPYNLFLGKSFNSKHFIQKKVESNRNLQKQNEKLTELNNCEGLFEGEVDLINEDESYTENTNEYLSELNPEESHSRKRFVNRYDYPENKKLKVTDQSVENLDDTTFSLESDLDSSSTHGAKDNFCGSQYFDDFCNEDQLIFTTKKSNTFKVLKKKKSDQMRDLLEDRSFKKKNSSTDHSINSTEHEYIEAHTKSSSSASKETDIIVEDVDSIHNGELHANDLNAQKKYRMDLKKKVPKNRYKWQSLNNDFSTQTEVFSLVKKNEFVEINDKLQKPINIKKCCRLFNQSKNKFNLNSEINEKYLHYLQENYKDDLENSLKKVFDNNKVTEVKTALKQKKCLGLGQISKKFLSDFKSCTEFDENGLLAIHRAVKNEKIPDIQQNILMLKILGKTIDVTTKDDKVIFYKFNSIILFVDKLASKNKRKEINF